MSDHVTNELDVAKAVASGELPSPTAFGNSKYFKMRISGSGTAWRSKHREYVYRSAAIWCSPKMCERVRGLPVISEHPEGGTLDGRSFYQQICGIIVLGVVEGDELWGVCRIIDDRAATILTAGYYDTSPSCVFSDDQNIALKIGDGDDANDLLIEGEPSFLDHVALVDTSAGNSGVWSKGDLDADNLGVEISETEKDSENA
jgi:hypothetical protein